MNIVNPKISVIMGIYNCAGTLPESIESLFNQTYKDFELIMCDDGSSDGTYRIAKEYKNKCEITGNHIVLLQNKTNMGLPFTLNKCLKYATGEFIARHDGDDISLPERFEKETVFLKSNPDIAFVSTWYTSFNENGDFKITKTSLNPDRKEFVSRTPFSHPSCMFRRSALENVGGYTVAPYLRRGQDIHLFAKLYSKGYKGANIQEVLYRFRDDNAAYKRRTMLSRLFEIRLRYTVFKMLKMPFYYYIYCLRPLLTMLAPRFIYDYFHKR